MIVDSVTSAKYYYGISESVKKALQYLETHDLCAMEPGKYEIDGDGLFVNVGSEYNPKRAEEGIWESHRKFIDIQYVIEGCEYMGYANIETLTTVGEYNEYTDIAYYEGKGDRVLVTEGNFIIF